MPSLQNADTSLGAVVVNGTTYTAASGVITGVSVIDAAVLLKFPEWTVVLGADTPQDIVDAQALKLVTQTPAAAVVTTALVSNLTVAQLQRLCVKRNVLNTSGLSAAQLVAALKSRGA